jgi:hypothetical protein
MGEENVEIVRRVYEGVTARQELPRELFDPDVELDGTVVEPLRGFEAAHEALRDYWQTFEDFMSSSKR